MSDADPADPVLFSARLRPHRSLNQRQFRVLLCGIGAISFVSTLPFVIMGAWPVAGFMGLDVLAVYVAFKASFRAARAYEDVEVTVVQLTLAKVDPRGLKAEWRFNPSWVRLERQDHAEFGTQRLDLVARADRVEVAGFLGPDAKGRFANDLGRALAEARRGYRYS
ncbi:MAG: DUF2244 domain-containing protein [Janthinobacterium lividum]